ncbi:ATP-binding protein [Jatrophihabitans sp. GAS493]|uniref:ATP-binding protein n=1 Tax=Jatrophihabitans sp. GAS493 TaxID=1907575 RepID=UPI0012FDBEA1|nr:ATP-binding protein [Jatrophihabitans sp. GAS493]
MSDLIDGLTVAGKRRHDQSWGDWRQADSFDAAVSVLTEDYLSGTDENVQADRVDMVAATFGLDLIDAGLLWSIAAPDLDASVALAYGALRDSGGTSAATVALALELAAIPTNSREAFARLGPDSPLSAHGLIEVIEGDTWLTSTLRTPNIVTATLAGAEPKDQLVSRLQCTLSPLSLPGGIQVQRALQQGEPLIWIHAPSGSAGDSMAAGAVEATGQGWLAIDARRCTAAATSTSANRIVRGVLGEAMARAARVAGLRGRALIVIGGEHLAEAAVDGDLDAFAVLAAAAIPVVIVGATAWTSSWMTRRPLTVTAEPLTAAERIELWGREVGPMVERDHALRQNLAGLRLSPEDVAETARYARLLAASQARELDAATVREAAREIGGSRSARGGRVRTDPVGGEGPTYDDLLLPERAIAPIRQLVTWARHRNEVTAHGPLRHRGRGLTALFAGSPGTGKTLAAHVVAEQLSMELFQVDLVGIVDKYIGETEKNLERVFRAAESLDVVLFFDEADALFGSRSEVSDAHDRYANQEVAYLLQRMEQFDGVTILATNLRGNLDRAFSRRMSFIVHFPDPDPETRRRLWHHHLAQITLDADDPVRVANLGDELALTGGDIRNIVLAATYDATAAGEPVGMRHIVAATTSEFQKLSRVLPEDALRRLYARRDDEN